MPRDSARARLSKFLLDHQGQVVTAKQLQQVAAPVSEWARRVRELRENDGWPIETNNDDVTLKPGEYRLTGAPPPKGSGQKGISQKLRAEVLDRDGSTCQMCGLAAGDIDPDTGRKVRMHLGHIVDKSLGGKEEASNLRTLCSTCNQGAKNVTTEKPSWAWLKGQVRRATMDDQKAIRDWLNQKFG